MADSILLADPNPTMQRVVELTCAEHGFKVVSVSDGQQALDYLVAERPALALISVTLPKFDGFEIAGLVRKRPDLQGIPVLLLAGAFETIDEARVRESGAAGVLVKPFEPGLVIKRVKELIGMSKTGGPPTSIPVPESSYGRTVTNMEASDRGAEEPASSAEPVPSDAARGKDTGGTWRELRELSDRGANAAPVETAEGAEGYFSKLGAAFESLTPGAPGAPGASGTPGASGAIDWRELQDEGKGSGLGLDGTYFVSERHAISAHPDSVSVAAPEVTRDVPASYGGIAAPTAGFAAAEAFAMLWAHEQGEPLPPVAPPPPLELSEQTVDAVVQRMTDQLTARVTDNLASRVTDGLAARLTTEVSARVAEGLAERIAAHVATRMMQEAFGDQLRRTVHDVSERLVREEIARIRAAATDSLRS